MLQELNKENLEEKGAFQRKTGILIKVLVPLLFLGVPILFLTYSESIGRIFLPFISQETIQKAPLYIRDVEFQTRLILILMLVLALFLGLLISRHFSRSLEKISRGLKKILAGDLDFRIKVESHDEMGEIIYFLNKLAVKLKESKVGLVEREKELEEKSLELIEKIKGLEASSQEAERARLATLNILEDVEETRLTLQERLEELEKFNKLAVGRELKMVELKEGIKKLKEELENKNTPPFKKTKITNKKP